MAPSQGDLFDGKEARRRRDKALARVTERAGPKFRHRVVEVLLKVWKPGDLVTGEDIRLECERRGVVPHHRMAWGGTINALARGENPYLELTAMRQPGKDPKCHARELKVYVCRW